ncbi:MAG: hypothetical protein Q4D56_05290 [Bacteroides sp.]|nr:hypothetical protein [Bacteroides sp.]
MKAYFLLVLCFVAGIALLLLCFSRLEFDLAKVCIGILALLAGLCIYYSIRLKRLSK